MATSTRREPVAQGGALFSTPKPSFSKDTQELLKLMMQESKLTNFQQRKLRENLMKGQALPTQCAPTSSGSGGEARQRMRGSGNKKKKKAESGVTGLRSKETIQKISTSDSTPNYRPPPQKFDGAREKQRLQNVMTYGRSDVQEPPARATTRQDPEGDVVERDRFKEVAEEIEERRQFLAEMEALGQGKEYHSKIMTEISQRVRELEVLDTERTAQLKQTTLIAP